LDGCEQKCLHTGQSIKEDEWEPAKRKAPTPMDVYDAATFSAITPLSEQSIELGHETVEFPAFTGGQWMYRKPVLP
jgi:hypothetical protein